MRDVQKMLSGLGCDSRMTEATIEKLDDLAAQGWREKLGPDGGSMKFRDAIRLLAK